MILPISMHNSQDTIHNTYDHLPLALLNSVLVDPGPGLPVPTKTNKQKIPRFNKNSKCLNYPYSPYLQVFCIVISLIKSTITNIWAALQ